MWIRSSIFNTNLTDTILLQHLLQSNHSVNVSGELHMPTRLLLTNHMPPRKHYWLKTLGQVWMHINQKQRGKIIDWAKKKNKTIVFEPVFYNGQLLKILAADLILSFININILCYFMVDHNGMMRSKMNHMVFLLSQGFYTSRLNFHNFGRILECYIR